MSAEDRITKLTEEQLLHLNSLKDKLEKIDSLTSMFLILILTLNRGQSVWGPDPQAPGGNVRPADRPERGTFPDYWSIVCGRLEPRCINILIGRGSNCIVEAKWGSRGGRKAKGGEQQAQVSDWVPPQDNRWGRGEEEVISWCINYTLL